MKIGSGLKFRIFVFLVVLIRFYCCVLFFRGIGRFLLSFGRVVVVEVDRGV